MKRKLTPEQVGRVWKSMPGGAKRFMKDWGPQAFADALIEEFNHSSVAQTTPAESMAEDTLYLALRTRAVAAGFRSVAHALDAAVAYKNAQSIEPPEFSTPANRWSEDGEKDPHGTSYDCERAELTLGHYTDDELANGAFLNYDRRMSVEAMLSPKEGQYMPIVWMTAVKERIRWLSRALVREQQRSPSLNEHLEVGRKELER